MSAIEFFDKIAKCLIQQNARCATRAGRPRTAVGALKDPVGFLLPKGVSHKTFDKNGAYTQDIEKILKVDAEQVDILRDLQAVHDLVLPERWSSIIEGMRADRFFKKSED